MSYIGPDKQSEDVWHWFEKTVGARPLQIHRPKLNVVGTRLMAISEGRMSSARPDPVIILAQLPSLSPAEIDTLLKEEAQHAVAHREGSQLLREIPVQLLTNDDPRILTSVALYGANTEALNELWERATTHPRASDSEALRKGLRRAIVLNRVIPFVNFKAQFWDEKKLEWLTSSLKPEPDNSEVIDAQGFEVWEQRHDTWWDLINLLQNESLPSSILADAISKKGAFSCSGSREHTSLLRHLSSIPSLSKPVSAYETGDYNGSVKLTSALINLLDERTQDQDYRSAVYEILISLSPEFGRGDNPETVNHQGYFSAKILRNWQSPDMAEILTNGGKTNKVIAGWPDLMPVVAFATWPSYIPAGKAPNFFGYAADYITKDLSLEQMLTGAKRDGNLFCLLAIWNRRIMLSDVKRAMLRKLIDSASGPVNNFELTEIYERRVKIWAEFAPRAETKWNEFGSIPIFSEVKWQVRLKKLLGISTKHDEVVFEVAKAIDRDQRGSILDITRRGADRAIGFLSLWILIVVVADQFFAQGEGLKALIGLLPTSSAQQ